jgi:hypothetical protein
MINELTQKATAIKTAANSTTFPSVASFAKATFEETTFAAPTIVAKIVITPVLPDVTDTVTDFAITNVNNTNAALDPTVTVTAAAAGATKNAYVLTGTVGTSKLTVTENASGKAPFAGNGVVKETVVLVSADNKEKLVINSVTNSVNTPDATNTEFGSSVDGLSQNRNVTYTNANEGITSVYSMSTKHAFNEASNGNQALNDATEKAYNYVDKSIKIVSHSQTGVEGRTNFVNGAESLVENASANYSYKTLGAALPKVTFDYAVAQNKVAATTGAITTETTTTKISNFALDNDGFKVTASGTIVHKQVFNDNGSLVNEGNPSIISATRTQTSDTYDVRTLKVSGGNADFSFEVKKFLDVARETGTDNTVQLNTGSSGTDGKVLNVFKTLGLGIDGLYDQNFDNSQNTAVANVPATLKGSFLTGVGDNTFIGTADNDDIKILSTSGKIVSAGAGNDTVTGNAGNDIINGGDGSDVLAGAAGADVFRFAPIRGALANIGKDTIKDFITTVDKIDLSAIDAKSSTPIVLATPATNEQFSFIGNSAFTAGAAGEGQLRFNAANNTLEGNTDANPLTVEFSVVLTGVTTIAATDFVL